MQDKNRLHVGEVLMSNKATDAGDNVPCVSLLGELKRILDEEPSSGDFIAAMYALASKYDLVPKSNAYLFDLIRKNNLYLVPCSGGCWYVGDWDRDWETRDDDSLGSSGFIGETPAAALSSYLQSNEEARLSCVVLNGANEGGKV